MKVVLAFILLAACTKPNEAGALQDEASTLEKFHQKELDGYAQRIVHILDRSRTIPPNIPAINETGKLLGEANEKLIALRQIIGPCATPNGNRDPKFTTQCQAGKTPYQQQLDAAIKAGNPDDLQKIVQDTQK